MVAEGTVFDILDTNFQFIGEMKKNKNNGKLLIEWFIDWLIVPVYVYKTYSIK